MLFNNTAICDFDIPNVREQEGNEKIHSQNWGTGREYKKRHLRDREWEFPLTPIGEKNNER